MLTATNSDRSFDIPYFSQRSHLFVLPTLVVIWVGMVGVGLSWMWMYEATPGEASQSPQVWPADSRIDRNTNRPLLIMFAHPRCPCTRASIGELALLMAHCPNRADARVLFYKPSNLVEDWEKTDLWESAKTIPGVTVVSDKDGLEGKKFFATTSGYTLLYSPTGQLLFSGGITGSRGHSGDNAGRSAIESLLLHGSSDRKQTFAFGCQLFDKDNECGTEYQKCHQ